VETSAKPNLNRLYTPVGAALWRPVGDGRGLWVYPQLYTFKLVIGAIGAYGYDDHWCYKDFQDAATAFFLWNPLESREPEGWVRHPPSGRRRFPDGDPATEEIRE
jgi:hypothetical protein